MSKQAFLVQLRKGMSGLPQEDVEERVMFYSEMIDDRMEEGLSEEEAVAEIGAAQEIAAQVVAEIPLGKIAKERMKATRQLRVGEIVLLALGAPIWLSLGIAAFAVIFSLYISFWAVIISLWAVFVSFIACSVGGVLACVGLTVSGNSASGLAMLAAGIVCAGFAIFAFYGCKAVTDGTVMLTKKMTIWTKNCFIRKEAA